MRSLRVSPGLVVRVLACGCVLAAASCISQPPGGGTGGAGGAAGAPVGGAAGTAAAAGSGGIAGTDAATADSAAGGSDAAAGAGGVADAGDAQPSGDGSVEAGDGAAGSGDGGQVSLFCGDAIRDPVAEECDDGVDQGDDACTDTCRVHDYLVVPPVLTEAGPTQGSRSLGYGRHVVAATSSTTALAFMEQTGSTHVLRVAFFDRYGRRLGDPIDAGAGAQPSQAADPVLAPLSADGSTFALAFGDLAQGFMHVALRTVSPGGAGSVEYASSDASIPVDQDPDLLWTGSDLVAVWASGIVGSGPQLRRFDANLVAPAGQQALGTSGGSPALASLQGSWAAAWRATDSSGLETIEVRTASASWSVGPFEPGAALERPALSELDASHLLVVFTEGTDPLSSGTSNVTRLRDAVLDLGAQGATQPMDVPVSLDPWASDDTLSQARPALARSGSRLYLAWQTESPLGDARGDEVFFREIGWDGVTLSLQPEVPLEADASRTADQDAPAIAGTPLGPQGALVTVWEDSTVAPLHTMLPDLVFGLRPTPIVQLGALDGGA